MKNLDSIIIFLFMEIQELIKIFLLRQVSLEDAKTRFILELDRIIS